MYSLKKIYIIAQSKRRFEEIISKNNLIRDYCVYVNREDQLRGLVNSVIIIEYAETLNEIFHIDSRNILIPDCALGEDIPELRSYRVLELHVGGSYVYDVQYLMKDRTTHIYKRIDTGKIDAVDELNSKFILPRSEIERNVDKIVEAIVDCDFNEIEIRKIIKNLLEK